MGMKEISKMTRSMERVRIHLLVVIYMKEISKMTRGMERVRILMLMVIYMKEITKMTRGMERGYLGDLTVPSFIAVIGRILNPTVNHTRYNQMNTNIIKRIHD